MLIACCINANCIGKKLHENILYSCNDNGIISLKINNVITGLKIDQLIINETYKSYTNQIPQLFIAPVSFVNGKFSCCRNTCATNYSCENVNKNPYNKGGCVYWYKNSTYSILYEYCFVINDKYKFVLPYEPLKNPFKIAKKAAGNITVLWYPKTGTSEIHVNILSYNTVTSTILHKNFHIPYRNKKFDYTKTYVHTNYLLKTDTHKIYNLPSLDSSNHEFEILDANKENSYAQKVSNDIKFEIMSESTFRIYKIPNHVGDLTVEICGINHYNPFKQMYCRTIIFDINQIDLGYILLAFFGSILCLPIYCAPCIYFSKTESTNSEENNYWWYV